MIDDQDNEILPQIKRPPGDRRWIHSIDNLHQLQLIREEVWIPD